MIGCFLLNLPAPPETYTLSLHDALPIFPQQTLLLQPAHLVTRRKRERKARDHRVEEGHACLERPSHRGAVGLDRKSTRLNSSHLGISYAVFCLKKKIKKRTDATTYCSHP